MGRAGRWRIQEFFSTVLLHPCLLCSMCLCVCWLHFSDFHHRCLALPFVCKEDSACTSLTSAAQCKRPAPLLNTDSPKMENGDSASFVSRLSSGPITRSGEGSRTMQHTEAGGCWREGHSTRRVHEQGEKDCYLYFTESDFFSGMRKATFLRKQHPKAVGNQC